MRDAPDVGDHAIVSMKFGSLNLSRGFHQRKTDYECCTQTFTGALSADCSAVELNQVTDDCQSEAESPVFPRRRPIGLTEPLKYMGQKIRFDPFAGITNRNHYMRFGTLQLDLY